MVLESVLLKDSKENKKKTNLFLNYENNIHIDSLTKSESDSLIIVNIEQPDFDPIHNDFYRDELMEPDLFWHYFFYEVVWCEFED